MTRTSDDASGDAVASEQVSHTDSNVTAGATAALLLMMWTGVPWAAPLAGAVPMALKLYRRRPHTPGKWVATVWVVGLLMIGLVGARAVRTVPLGAAAVEQTRAWLEGDSAPPGPKLMLAESAAFVIAAAGTRGVLGCVVLAGIALQTAVSASVVFASSTNVIAAIVAAVPAWNLAWVAGVTTLLGPLSVLLGARGDRAREFGRARRSLLIGAALLAAALILRVATAPAYTELARRLTIH